MEKYPTRRHYHRESEAAWSLDDRECAIRFLLNVINATICSSGDDYEGALQDFFPQLQALGHLIGARDLDDVALFLRRRAHLA